MGGLGRGGGERGGWVGGFTLLGGGGEIPVVDVVVHRVVEKERVLGDHTHRSSQGGQGYLRVEWVDGWVGG